MIAAITGAGSGIGRALAVEAAARGMAVAACDIDAAGLEVTRARIAAAGGSVSTRIVDVRDPAAVAAFADAVAGQGQIARLFLNAGILRGGPVATQPMADWALMIDVNLRGVIHGLQAFLPHLTAQADPSRIVITGSQASLFAYPKLPLYAASKHALWGLAEALRGELAADAPQVGVSLLCPGAIATPMTGASDDGAGARDAYMPPAEAARIAHDGADAGRFWIFTHPGFRQLFEARISALMAEAWGPEPPEQQFGAPSANYRGLAPAPDKTE